MLVGCHVLVKYDYNMHPNIGYLDLQAMVNNFFLYTLSMWASLIPHTCNLHTWVSPIFCKVHEMHCWGGHLTLHANERH